VKDKRKRPKQTIVILLTVWLFVFVKLKTLKTMKNSAINFGKIANNVGFSAGQGITRKLTKKELKAQRDLQKGK
jgi:hypothetical protein